MASYGGIEASDARLLPDTGSQLISFNLVALQSMMQAVAREVAERASRSCAHHTAIQAINTECSHKCCLGADMCGRPYRHQAP